MTFPAVDVDLDRHLDAFDDADRLAQIGDLIDGLQDYITKVDHVIMGESGQTREHLTAIYNVLCNEMYSLESLLEVERWQARN